MRAALLLLAAALSAPAAAENAGPRPPVFKGPLRVDYPAEALRREQQGRVGYRLTIDESGKVTDCVVTSSSGFPLLDDATCRMALKAAFEPALDADGRPTSGTWQSTEVYSLGRH